MQAKVEAAGVDSLNKTLEILKNKVPDAIFHVNTIATRNRDFVYIVNASWEEELDG